MHLKSVILLVIACTLFACNWSASDTDKPAITTDTLRYEYKIVKERASDCGTKPDSGCAIAKITYPEFHSTQMLNKTVKQKILGLFGDSSTRATIENYRK